MFAFIFINLSLYLIATYGWAFVLDSTVLKQDRVYFRWDVLSGTEKGGALILHSNGREHWFGLSEVFILSFIPLNGISNPRLTGTYPIPGTTSRVL